MYYLMGQNLSHGAEALVASLALGTVSVFMTEKTTNIALAASQMSHHCSAI